MADAHARRSDGPAPGGPFPVVSVERMRALEAAAVAAGVSEPELQERAGRAVADAISARVPPGGRVVALVGAGNNGRDAVVAARHLAARGADVSVWLWERHAVTDAEVAQLAGMGLAVERLPARAADLDGDDGRLARPLDRLRSALAAADVAIDGLLGVGGSGPMRAGLAAVASAVNAAREARRALLVVAVDVPSGLDATTGEAPGVVVRADLTVTFGAMKAGLLRFPGAARAGEAIVRPIGLPAEALERESIRVLDAASVASLVPDRPLDGHKYTFGRVLVVAGSDQYVGAACLGSAAAARSGCGLVGLISTEAVKHVLAVRLPEATFPLTLDVARGDPDAHAEAVAALLTSQQALLIGPGLGRADATDRFVRALLAANGAAERPVRAVIDADALSLLGGWDRWWERIGTDNVLTPHAGELARLLGDGRDVLARDAPWDVARACAERWRQVIVFKGPFTTVAAPDGRARVWPRANPALSTGGTGDVLAGLCAGLIAQGTAPFEAACLGVAVHALAGEAVVRGRGWRTLLASDLIDEIPSILARLVGGRVASS